MSPTTELNPDPAALDACAPSTEGGVLHLPLSRFRDTEDTLPRAQRLPWPRWVELLAPQRPPVRDDITRHVRQREAQLDAMIALLLRDREPPPVWERHPWFRALEREAWALRAQGGELEKALHERAAPMRATIRRQAKSGLPCWSPAVYTSGATRGTNGVVALTALVLDHDDALSIDEALHPWMDWPLLLHTSWSHRPEHPRFRIVLPLDRPVPARAWSRAWRWASTRALHHIDPACKDPARLWLLPAMPTRDSPYHARVHDPGGELLGLDWERLPPTPDEQPAFAVAREPAPASVRRLLRTSREHRERAARMLNARLNGRRAEDVKCPACGRKSVWFWLEPGAQDGARCQHQHSCGWWGGLDELLRQGAIDDGRSMAGAAGPRSG